MTWIPFERAGLQIITRQIITSGIDLATDLLDRVKLHCKIEQDEEDELVLDYINAAIDAGENTLQKDIYPRVYELLWTGGPTLHINVGNVYNLAVTVPAPTVDDPLAVADDLSNLTQRGSADFRGAGLVLYRTYGSVWYVDPATPEATTLGKTVTFTSGFTSVDDLPGAIKSFIYAMVGMLYEPREIVNIGASKYVVDEIPVYLLEPLKTAVIA